MGPDRPTRRPIPLDRDRRRPRPIGLGPRRLSPLHASVPVRWPAPASNRAKPPGRGARPSAFHGGPTGRRLTRPLLWIAMFDTLLKSIFGSKHDRDVKRVTPI